MSTTCTHPFALFLFSSVQPDAWPRDTSRGWSLNMHVWIRFLQQLLIWATNQSEKTFKT